MNEVPCTAKPKSQCNDCSLSKNLMCHYDRHDTVHFFMIILPFFVTSIGGVITAGLGLWLLGWLAYMIFFFFVWEARVLCSHCPYWAEAGHTLHCHANYGVIKLWKYRPGPMSRSEQIQFILGALIIILYPLVLLIIGHEYLLAGIALSTAISFTYLLRRNICVRCINFSCPLNGVGETTRQAFFDKNAAIKQAWKKE